MSTDKPHRIPKRDQRSYTRWYLALNLYANTIKAAAHLNCNPPEPHEAQEQKKFNDRNNRLLSAVLCSVSSNILGLLIGPQDRPTPYDLITKIISHIDDSTMEDHKCLKADAIFSTVLNGEPHPIPTLDRTNYAPWYLALQIYAEAIKATDLLHGNPSQPTEAQELETLNNKSAILLSAVLNSVPPNILGLLIAPKDHPTPHDLITKIISHVDDSSAEGHKYLKVEAESIPWFEGKVDDFIKSHLEVRRRMVGASYPNIRDERTTVDFIINTIRLHPHPMNRPIVFHMLANKPTTISEFVRKCKDLYSFLYATSTTFRGTYASQPFTGYQRYYGYPQYGITWGYTTAQPPHPGQHPYRAGPADNRRPFNR